MRYITTLKNSSAYKLLLNNGFLVAFFLVLVAIAIHHWIAILFVIVFGIFLYSREIRLLYCSIVLSCVYLLHYGVLEMFTQPLQDPVYSGIVVDVKTYKNVQRITISQHRYKVHVYDSSMMSFEIGQVITVQGQVRTTEEVRIPGAMDYQQYLKINRIRGSMYAESIEVHAKRFHLASVQDFLSGYVDRHFNNDGAMLLKSLVLGNKEDFTSSFQEALQKTGVLHLFAISGTHIALFIVLLSQLLTSVGVKRIELWLCVFLGIYMIVTNFPVSVVRAGLTYYVMIANKKTKLHLSSLDCWSILIVGFMLLDPYVVHQLGFQFSFLVAGMILLLAPCIKSYNKFEQVLMVSIGAIVISFPLAINIHNHVNLLSPLLNVFFIYVMEFALLPASFAVLFIPWVGGLYDSFATAFVTLLEYTSRVFYWGIAFPRFSFHAIAFYYGCILAVLWSWKKPTMRKTMIVVFIGFLGIMGSVARFDAHLEVVFLDLYNGESILIKDRWDACNVLIDTGDGRGNEVSKYLERRGIRRIDYMILTHNHLDHNGEAQQIVHAFDVDQVIIGPYDPSRYLGATHYVVMHDQIITCGNVELMLIPPKEKSRDENDNSLVVYTQIGTKGFLFLGDLTKAGEEKLMKYALQVDVVKIAHHGSKTSTSSKFLEHFKPQYAIIQSGRLDKFGFPHTEPIDALQKFGIQVYRTDMDYTILYQVSINHDRFVVLKQRRKQKFIDIIWKM
jgi:competence protein ComEC